MVNKCVVFGCTTGYASNSDKLPAFTVPSDKKRIKKWQIAILRDDIVLKPGHVIYAKHFLPEDILTERLIRGLDGSVLGTVRIPLNYSFTII